MPGGSTLQLEAGRAALAAGRWEAARDAFRNALATEDSPEALDGLAHATWWLGAVPEALRCWEAAYAAYRRRHDTAAAAAVATQLSLLYNANFGNRAVSAGWASRAARLADETGEAALVGWALLARAALSDDASAVEAMARQAQALAAEAGDRDLELCALSTMGSALVDAGRATEGAALLDEALAGALGGDAVQLDSIVFTSCLLMQSCYRAADFVRVIEWCQALAPFIERYGCPYVNATCRAHYGAVLVATGDWDRAESELATALSLAGEALPAVRAEAAAHLADLRLAQGRPQEARRLLQGLEAHLVVQPALIAAEVARGDAAAASLLRHRLRDVAPAAGGGRLRESLGDALLRAGDHAAAAAEGTALVAAGEGRGGVVEARGRRLLGRVHLARGERAEARDQLQEALGTFSALEMPLEVARTRLLLAEWFLADDLAVAVAEAKAAHVVFAGLGAAPDADRAAAWLRRRDDEALVVRHPPLTPREDGVLLLLADGLTNPEIADRLFISRRTVEHHVASILSKLGLRNRAEVAAFVARNR